MKPEEGWIKVNFDRASTGNPGPSGAGYVVRDWNMNILAMGAKKLVKVRMMRLSAKRLFCL